MEVGMTVSYSITGVNEDQVVFTATQQKQVIDTVEGQRDTTITLSNRGKAPVDLCWTKLDRKAKKVNFLITQPSKDLQAKASY
jgi:P pilus assembly chaperone PapD